MTELPDDNRHSCDFDGQFFSGVFRIVGCDETPVGFNAYPVGASIDFFRLFIQFFNGKRVVLRSYGINLLFVQFLFDRRPNRCVVDIVSCVFQETHPLVRRSYERIA